MRNSKNQCVELFSSLIEVFGDDAVTQILRVIKVQLGLEKEQEEAKDGSQEPVYVSTNERHVYKRMDVGMILLGLFVEDF